MASKTRRTLVEGDVTTEIEDLSGGLAGKLNTDELLAKAGSAGGTWTETRPDGTTVTYEVDVEEEEEEFEVMEGRQDTNRDLWETNIFSFQWYRLVQ